MGLTEAQGGQRRVDAARIVPAVQPVHGLEQFGLAADQLIHDFWRGVGSEGLVDGGELRFNGLDLHKQGIQHFSNGGLAVQLGELREVTDFQSLVHGDCAGVGLNLFQDQLEQRGLA